MGRVLACATVTQDVQQPLSLRQDSVRVSVKFRQICVEARQVRVELDQVRVGARQGLSGLLVALVGALVRARRGGVSGGAGAGRLGRDGRVEQRRRDHERGADLSTHGGLAWTH
eukprot:1901186-Pleurochrysis_carterae.AAC.2